MKAKRLFIAAIAGAGSLVDVFGHTQHEDRQMLYDTHLGDFQDDVAALTFDMRMLRYDFNHVITNVQASKLIATTRSKAVANVNPSSWA